MFLHDDEHEDADDEDADLEDAEDDTRAMTIAQLFFFEKQTS